MGSLLLPFFYFLQAIWLWDCLLTLRTTESPVVGVSDAATLHDTIPPPSDKTLFYLYRSTNDNLVLYDLRLDSEGHLDEEEPVHPYWIRNTEGGKVVELSYIQRKFAYGLHQELIDPKNKTYKLTFVSFDKKIMYLARSPKDKKYHVYIDLFKRKAQLRKILVKIEPGGTFWFPKVPYIEAQGIDEATGLLVKERFKP